MRSVTAIVLLAIFLCPVTALGGRQITSRDFPYIVPVKGMMKKGALYRVPLSDEVLQKCGGVCDNARLLDADDHEVPYVIIEEKQVPEKTETHVMEITGYHETEHGATIIAKMPEKHQPISSLSIETADRDFKKTVRVYGSRDEHKWEMLAEDSVYDFSSQVDLRKTSVRFRESDVRHYKLDIINAGRERDRSESIQLKYNGLDFSVDRLQTKPVRIVKISGTTSPEREKEAVFDEKELSGLTSQIDREGNSIMTIETGLPFDRISFDISNAYYYRKVSVYYSADGKKNPYQLLGQGSIYRFPLTDRKEQKNYVECMARGTGFYKFIIENGNNPAIAVHGMRLSWVRRSLYFIALNDATAYHFCFGNYSLKKTAYDLSSFIHQGNWSQQKYEMLDSAAILQNVGYKPDMSAEEKARKEKNLLVGIVMLLVIGIGYWLYALIRTSRKRNV